MMTMDIYNIYNANITSNPRAIVASANPKRLTSSNHCLDIANALLEPFSKIATHEQAIVAALLSAIVHRVESPFSSRLTNEQIDAAYDSSAQLLAIAVWAGIDIRDSRYVNGRGYETDTAELFRRTALKLAREIDNTRLCVDSPEKGLRYINQDLKQLRRSHPNYRIYHKYDVAIRTRATGERFDRGEDMFYVGLSMWEEEGERTKGMKGMMKWAMARWRG
ncbi:hypothetical protein FRC11_000337 [Ceratobasidium sp. 423]|nr:hypothetical protein FRC11_000337 [Ceratobasidium sp. 423]